MSGIAEQLDKKLAYVGVPVEDAYGFPQAVQVGGTIFVPAHLSLDDRGNLIGAASGQSGAAVNMELQMRTTYANAAKVLATFGASLDHVVEKTIYVTDVDAAFAVPGRVRKAAYGTEKPRCASTFIGSTSLVLPQQLVEISFTAILPRAAIAPS